MNPWRHIALSDYEGHMQSESVLQLQTLDALMEGQLQDYPVATVCILGIAGGNGLRHIDPARIRNVYGVDINPNYLSVCTERHPELNGCLIPICADLTQRPTLPPCDLVIADLFIEYIGYDLFADAVVRMDPKIVSCIIQIDPGTEFVSRSPYLERLNRLDSIHRTIHPDELTRRMERIGFRPGKTLSRTLPNQKRLQRLDFLRSTDIRTDR